MQDIRKALYELLEADHPMTVRQVFYRAVSAGAIGKTESEYKHTIVRLLTDMRLSGEIPFAWIADNTRWMRKPRTYHSLQGMMEHAKAVYRRSVWDSQDSYVEVWLEKDALAGVLYPETEHWDVPLMVTRGYSSVSYLFEAASVIQQQRKPAFLYYLGDHDPSGLDITRATEARLREFAPDAEIHFERLAVTQRQIQLLHLPTRPTKVTDSRGKNFKGESVEVDAIPSATLRALVRDAIEQHVDAGEFERLQGIERLELESLRRISELLE